MKREHKTIHYTGKKYGVLPSKWKAQPKIGFDQSENRLHRSANGHECLANGFECLTIGIRTRKMGLSASKLHIAARKNGAVV